MSPREAWPPALNLDAPSSKPRRLEKCHSIADLRALARRRVPAPAFHHADGAAEDEKTFRNNTNAFDDVQLIPRSLVDVEGVRTQTRLLGQDIDFPIMLSPTGASRFYHADGELAVARAAAAAKTIYGVSTMSTYGLEEIAAAAAGPKMFQLYIFRDRSVTRKLMERCKRAGYQAMCLTVDASVHGNRERDRRTGWGIPIRLSPASVASFALCPGWLLGLIRGGPISVPNIAALIGSNSIAAQTRFVGEQLNPSVTWDDLRELISLWDGPFAIKGVLCAEDARRVVDVGASAVIVSNHGGRQLDGAVAPIEMLPEIAGAVGKSIEVILDGGVRRGSHVLKALALGAKACSIGRPYVYGLGAAGAPGVAKALEILRSELVRAMKLSGCTDVNQIAPSLVRRTR